LNFLSSAAFISNVLIALIEGFLINAFLGLTNPEFGESASYSNRDPSESVLMNFL
jgi:hypothetical protein